MVLTKDQAEDFLYREVRLLDEGRLEEWLQLFTEDGIYWLPLTAGHDPQQEPSIAYDDKTRRARRVYQLVKDPRFAQRPPSRTVHMISNVEVGEEEGQGNGRMVLRCSLAVFEIRPGGHGQLGLGIPRWVAGRCEYQLRLEKEWRIALKKVTLIDRDLPMQNLSFIV